jgi:hypothetical protein
MLETTRRDACYENGADRKTLYTDRQACVFSAETKFGACKFIWGISGNRLITHLRMMIAREGDELR